MDAVVKALGAIEQDLTEAAELFLTGSLSSSLYITMKSGCVAKIPMPKAPHHIPVLNALRRWVDAELITLSLLESLQHDVIAAARVVAPTNKSCDSQSTTSRPETEPSPRRTSDDGSTPSGKKRKQGKHPVQKTTLFSVLPGAKKTLVRAEDLRKQREAALRNEHYDLSEFDMASFHSEDLQQQKRAAEELACKQLYRCPKCPRAFPERVALQNHMHIHSESVKEFKHNNDRSHLPPVTFDTDIADDLTVKLQFRIGGKTYQEMKAAREAADEAAAAALAERQVQMRVESFKRQRMREAQEEDGEHRRGSHIRRQYTAKDKLRILEVFDAINADPLVLKKVQAFHSDPRATRTPYTTVRTHWASAVQRARISKAASKEHAATLLRNDSVSRKKGKFAEMEKELYTLFKERRARGRRVSARWLTATGRQLMKRLHPEHAADFTGGKSWRRRFAVRFSLTQRRKTNVKNKQWADTEPVLLRYFSTLRRRLQLDDGAANNVAADTEQEDAEEPEPDDVNPTREGEAELDSSDDEDADDSLISAEMAMPDGFKLSEIMPQAEQLLYKGARAKELIGKSILFNWRGVGWVDGNIVRCNTDGRVKMKVGEVTTLVNFFVYYTDQTEARHCLTVDTHGDKGEREDGRWLLLERKD